MTLLPEIRLNTVGQIENGAYTGWYVLVIPKNTPGFGDSYTVYVCTDATFTFEPQIRECFDEWVQNMPSLEGLFEEKYTDVTWHPEITPPVMGATTPRASSLAERFRERRAAQRSTKDDLTE